MPSDIRHFITIVTNPILNESRSQFMDMLRSVGEINDEATQINGLREPLIDINAEIQTVEDLKLPLKAKIWYLKYMRVGMLLRLRTIARSDQSPMGKALFQKIEKMNKPDFVSEPVNQNTVGYVKNMLTHYSGFPSEIFNHIEFGSRPPSIVFSEMKDAEEKWAAKNVGFQPFDEKHHVLLQFPDGMTWVDRVEGSCSVEGKAMGHCGNVGSAKPGDSLLSLRRKVARGNRDQWETFLTFILDEDGYLGEMKGRNNNKPAAKYHPYIIALLKEKYIKGIVGGGYKPENNFQIADLSDEDRAALYKSKPTMMPFSLRLKREGMSRDLVDAVMRVVKTNVVPEGHDHRDFWGWSEEDERFYLMIGDRSPADTIYSITDDRNGNFYNHFIGNADYGAVDAEVVNALNALNAEQLMELDFDEEYVPGSFTEDSFVSLDRDARGMIKQCVNNAIDYSYQEEADVFVTKALAKHPFIKTQITYGKFPNQGTDIKIKAWMTAERICEIAGNDEYITNTQLFGWWGPKADMSVRWLDCGKYEPTGSCDPDAVVARYRELTAYRRPRGY